MSDSVQKAEVTSPVTNVWSLSVICVLGWIIPGLGHFLLRRHVRALIFLLLITFLFFWGLDLGAKIYQYEPQQPLTFFALIAQVGMGLPYFIARFIASYAMMHPASPFHGFAENFQFGNGNIESVTFEYGNTFTIVAGLLNFLVVLDAYDIAVGRKRG